MAGARNASPASAAAPRGLLTRFHLLELGVILAVSVIGLVKVPETYGYVARWGLHGSVDWAWPRDVALALAPAAALLASCALWIHGMRARGPRLEMQRHILEPALSVWLGLCVAVQFGLLLVGTGSDLDLIRLLAFGLAPGLVLFGIVFAEAERHTYAGMRLPWRIEADRTWRRAHRLGGYLFVLGGIALALLAWLDPDLGVLLPAFPAALLLPPLVARLASLR